MSQRSCSWAMINSGRSTIVHSSNRLSAHVSGFFPGVLFTKDKDEELFRKFSLSFSTDFDQLQKRI